MDLLEQYKQQNPEAFRTKERPQMADAYGREYSGMVALAMRLSGGRIRDARQASYVLAVTAGVILLISLLFFFGVPGSAPTQPNFINP